MAEKTVPKSVQEYELLKNTFKGNNDLLVKIRTLLLGFEISDEYKKIIRTTFGNPDVFKAFRKKIFTIYEEDVPEASIESLNDNWSSSTEKIHGATKEKIYQEIAMKKEVIATLKKGVELLKNPDGEKVDTKYDEVEDEWGIKLLARNYYVGSIQQGIATLSVIINADMPTSAQAIKKAKKD